MGAIGKSDFQSDVFYFRTYKDFCRKFPEYKDQLFPSVLNEISDREEETVIIKGDCFSVFKPKESFIVEFVVEKYYVVPYYTKIPASYKTNSYCIAFIEGYKASRVLDRSANKKMYGIKI